jgi:hypothetical protein
VLLSKRELGLAVNESELIAAHRQRYVNVDVTIRDWKWFWYKIWHKKLLLKVNA